jgi:ribonuclease P protein component
VASKKLGDAVRRNRAKRLIREIFRRSATLAGARGLDIVAIPRRELFDAAYASLDRDFHAALRRSAGRTTTSIAG